MKILYVINSLAAGGSEKLVTDMANDLDVKGHEVNVFTFVSNKDVFSNLLSPSINFKPWNDTSFLSFSKLSNLFNLIKKNEVIHVHLFPSFYIVGLLSLFFTDKTFIYTEHSTYNRRRNWKYKLIEKFIYSRYSFITCISKGVKEQLENWIGSKVKIKLINNFINLKVIENAPAFTKNKLGFKESDKLIVMVGSFRDNSKDQKTLINAIKLVPNNYKLLLIGDGVLKKQNELYVSSIGLTEQVHFFGNRTDVYSILKACDYGVLSSNWEGFGLVALEYMVCGLPSLGSNVEGLNKVIADKDYLFEVGDSKKIADIILKLENDTKRKSQLLDLQNKKLKLYDINEAMGNFINLYKA